MAAVNDLTLLRCDLGIGVDLAADPTTWAFTDMAAPASITDLPLGAKGRLFEAPIPIKVGKSGEASQVVPSSVTFELDNSDGWLTPDNPMSPWWPDIAVGLPCRLSVLAGSPYLRAVGSTVIGATSVDHADYDITSDLTARAEIVYYGAPTLPAFIGPNKYIAAGNQRSWLWWIDIDGHLVVRTSPDGTIAAAIETRSTEPLPRFGAMGIGVQVDVNNGAGGNTVRFEWAETVDTPDADWADLGAPVVNAGTTSIFNSTAPLQVCQQTLCPVRKIRLYAGLGSGGGLRSSVDFTDQTPGATGFTIGGRPWVVNGEVTQWHTRFFGAVSEVTLLAPEGRVSGTQRVRITAAGDLRRLDVGNKPLRSAITRLVTSPSNEDIVVAHWPLEDGRNSTRLASSTPGVAPMSIKGKFALAADDRVLGSAPLLSISPGDNAFRTADIPQIPQVVGVTWEVAQFIRIDDPAVSPATTQVFAVDTNGRVATWRVTINDTQVTITGLDDDAAGVVLDTINDGATPRWFDRTSIIVLRVADDGVNVDWRVSIITTDDGFNFSTFGSFVGNTGVPFRLRNSCTGPPGGVTLGHTIVTTGTNLAGGASWLAPADSGFRGETDVERAIRLCQEEGVSLAYVGDPATGVRMGPQTVATLDSLLRECADTGLATFGELMSGPGLTYRPLRSHYNQEPRLTVDGLDKARNLDFPFELVTDDKNLRTHIIAARPDGSEYTAVAAGFDPDRDPVRDERVTVNVDTDEALPNQASWRLHVANCRKPRYPAMNTLLSEAGPEFQDEFLALVPGDRALLVNPPPTYGPDPVDQLVTGWTETVSLALWKAQLTGLPAEPYEIAVRDDPVRGRRDTAGSVLDADFDAGTDTTMDVATTLGPLWSTSVPVAFELWVGGARVTVTAIGAPAGAVQTFTVSAAIVNGVVKLIPAGTTVRLWRTPIRAL